MKKSIVFVALVPSLISSFAIADNIKSQVFSDTLDQEIQVLSSEEMLSTEGQWGPYGALGGGALSGIGYAGGAITTGTWNWYNFAGAVAGGAAGGFVGGPASWYYRSRAAFGTGAAFGVGSSFF